MGELTVPRWSTIVLTAVALLGLLAGSASVGAQTAGAATRAVLSWDTDDTDIDLHVWDGFGNHAYFGDQDALSTGELSTDILYGFGPEDYTETYYETLPEGEPLYFGVCYYGSHWDNDVVPATTITLTIWNPDGSQRTVKRVLRNEKDSFLLGASPQGSVAPPTASFCGNRAAYPESVTGDQTPSEEIANAGCSSTTKRVGAAVICADSITGGGSSYEAWGHVLLNGALSVGDGPVRIDTSAGRITTPAGAPLAIQRGSGPPIPIGTAQVTVETPAVTDTISGRDKLAKIVLGAPVLSPLSVGQLQTAFTNAYGKPPVGGGLNAYLDARDGGGIIFAGSVKLNIAPDNPSSTLAIGIHRTPSHAARIVGGSARFESFSLPGSPWKASLALAYQSGNDQWDASGGVETPVLGLDVEGTIIGGQLDAIGVKISRDVPLGQTGFILRSVRGKVSGMVSPPMRFTAGITGKWGSVPGLDQGVLILDDASLTFGTDLSASMNGEISFGIPRGPVKGKMNIGGRLAPFGVNGSIEGTISIDRVLELSNKGQISISQSKLQAVQSASGKVLGQKTGAATVGMSNNGLGATTEICIPQLLGGCRRHAIGAAMRWDRFGRFSFGGDALEQIGIRSNRARRAQAGGAGSVIRAHGNEPMLIWQVDGQIPGGRLAGPGSAGCRAEKPTRLCSITYDADTNVTTAVAFDPQRGEWQLRSDAALQNPSVERADVVPIVERPAFAQRGSKRSPLARTAKRLALRWTARGPSSKRVQVDVYLSPAKGQPGTLIRANRKARDTVKLRRTDIPAGGQYARLVIKVDGIEAGELWSKKAVWVR